MSTGRQPTSAGTEAQGLLGMAGYRRVTDWAAPGRARGRAAEIIAAHRSARCEVVRNPHLDHEWAQSIVRAPRLLGAVQDLIGRDVAVENTFLVVKWPGRDFGVPRHQDGINDRLELDPQRSVAAWLALTDADATSGCLRVVPGSQQAGYLSYELEATNGAGPGRCPRTARRTTPRRPK